MSHRAPLCTSRIVHTFSLPHSSLGGHYVYEGAEHGIAGDSAVDEGASHDRAGWRRVGWRVATQAIDFKLDQAIKKDGTVLGIYQIVRGQLKIGLRTLKSIELPRPAGYATPRAGAAELSAATNNKAVKESVRMIQPPGVGS
jgi:hypothetical protein